MVEGYLVIVSCGSQKIWSRFPAAGPTAAQDAYTSNVFTASRRYAEHFADRWLILSAGYGFIAPDFIIPENYDVSFYGTDAVSPERLCEQVDERGLADAKSVGVLDSAAYFARVKGAFADHNTSVRSINGNVGFPPSFIGLVNKLIAHDVPFPEDLPR